MAYKLEKKHKRVAVFCENCGTEFCVYPYIARNRKKHFCDLECRTAYYSTKRAKREAVKQRGTKGWTLHNGYRRVLLSHLPQEYRDMANKMLARNKNKESILEHRVLYAVHIGRPIERKEIVHHKDGNRLNNDISNLELIDIKDHTTKHRRVNNEFACLVTSNKKLLEENMFLKLTIESMHLQRQLAVV